MLQNLKSSALALRQNALSLSTRTGVALGTTMGVMGLARADGGIDVSAVTAAILLAVAAVGVIGVAILGVKVAVKTYRWVAAAIG